MLETRNLQEQSITRNKDTYLVQPSFTYQELMLFTKKLYFLIVEEDNQVKNISYEEQVISLTLEIKLHKSQVTLKKNNSKWSSIAFILSLL